MGWSKPPTGFANVVEQEQNKRLRAAAMQALEGVIERSPVDSGRFRGNNRVSVGTKDMTSVESTDKSGRRTLAEGGAKIGSVRRAFEVIYVQNNVEYSEVIEFGEFKGVGAGITRDGYSIQAPYGVYAVTFNNLREAADRGL